MSEEQKLETTEHIVAYIDLLGMKNQISNADVLNIIYRIYTDALEGEIFQNTKFYDDMKIKFFSDNIVISIKCNEAKYSISAENTMFMDFSLMLCFCGIFQLKCAQNAILLRGALTVGELFHSDIMVWGKGLVKAYSLESESAIFPRVIIDNELLERVNISHTNNDVLIQDNDGLIYINYLKCESLRHQATDEILNSLLQSYETLLATASNNTKALQKVLWHKNYLTSTCYGLFKE